MGEEGRGGFGKLERRTKGERDKRDRFAYVILQEVTRCKQQVQNETDVCVE